MSAQILGASPRYAWRYWMRNATVFRRLWLLSLTAWFIEPVVYLLGMGLGLGEYLERIRGVQYLDFIAPGLVALSAMYGATFEATWSAYFKLERSGIYEAVRATPLAVEEIALGEVFWAATRATIYGTAFVAVALPFGVVHSWWVLAVVPGLALVGLMFAVIGLAYTYSITRIDYLAYYWTLFLTPMFMFSGVFFPLDRLPQWLQTVAWFMPMHHAVNLFRALMLTGEPSKAAAAALWIVVATLVFLPVPLKMLRRRLMR